MEHHGMRYTREYTIWNTMKNRCLNPKSKDYPRYGAKGITVCEQWINSFTQFYKDMGKRPDGFSIERIDNTKGYFPENCIWADRSTQQRNKSNSLWIEWKGQLTHIMEVAKDLGITKGAAHLRYKRGKIYG